MELNLKGRLRIMKELELTPNFTQLARVHGLERHTLKKYYDSGGIIPPKHKHPTDDPEMRNRFKRKLHTVEAELAYICFFSRFVVISFSFYLERILKRIALLPFDSFVI